MNRFRQITDVRKKNKFHSCEISLQDYSIFREIMKYCQIDFKRLYCNIHELYVTTNCLAMRYTKYAVINELLLFQGFAFNS